MPLPAKSRRGEETYTTLWGTILFRGGERWIRTPGTDFRTRQNSIFGAFGAVRKGAPEGLARIVA
jgi:hypothetical protein